MTKQEAVDSNPGVQIKGIFICCHILSVVIYAIDSHVAFVSRFGEKPLYWRVSLQAISCISLMLPAQLLRNETACKECMNCCWLRKGNHGTFVFNQTMHFCPTNARLLIKYAIYEIEHSLSQARRNGIGARGANKRKRAPNSISEKSETITLGNAPEVLLCLCGTYSS